MRSLAAITWAASAKQDPSVGLLLASNSDPQVRRTLTHALAETTDTTAETVKDELREDARFSIRRVL